MDEEFDDFYMSEVCLVFFFFLQDLEDRDLESGDMELKIFFK